MKEHSWKYKDGNRVYWRLDVKMSYETVDRPELDEVDHIWDYRLINEDLNKTIISGNVVGQYEMMPSINEFLADIQSQTTHLLLGMAKYAA